MNKTTEILSKKVAIDFPDGNGNDLKVYREEAVIGMLDEMAEVFPCNICVLDKNYLTDKEEIERLEKIIFQQSDTITSLQQRLVALQHVNNELLGLGNIKRY
jgi:hypothetical protein